MSELSLTDVPKAVRDQYQKGMAAYQRDNTDYAIDIFSSLLVQYPAFYPCREALRASQIKKAKKKSGFFRKVLGSASNSGSLAKAQILAKTRPVDALAVAEKILNQDPDHSLAHKILAEAALAAGFPKTAVLSLEIVVKANPTDKHAAIKLAQSLSAAGNINRAEKLYDELINLYPSEPELLHAAKNVAANKTMSQGGYDKLEDGSGSYRDILKNESEAIELEQQNREVKDTDTAQRLLLQYETQLESEPQNQRLIRTIAELHAGQRNYEQAMQYTQRLIKMGEGDPSLDKSHAELHERLYEQQLQALDPQAADHAERVATMEQERDEFRVQECRARSERYPNDLTIRFELGEIYFQQQEFSLAIKEFQKAQHNPHKKVKSLMRLGQCFARRQMHDLAARSLQTAIQEKQAFDNDKKEMIYELGCVLEQLGKTEEAMEEFKKIYEVDIEFKDVADKVDAYYASR